MDAAGSRPQWLCRREGARRHPGGCRVCGRRGLRPLAPSRPARSHGGAQHSASDVHGSSSRGVRGLHLAGLHAEMYPVPKQGGWHLHPSPAGFPLRLQGRAWAHGLYLRQVPLPGPVLRVSRWRVLRAPGLLGRSAAPSVPAQPVDGLVRSVGERPPLPAAAGAAVGAQGIHMVMHQAGHRLGRGRPVHSYLHSGLHLLLPRVWHHASSPRSQRKAPDPSAAVDGWELRWRERRSSRPHGRRRP
mmetsp:Transcript_58635/g.188547  ORF Transcript_58635/g.188547 Transcript_58635/m.188547 type:complete len:244 (-) Transcript_58635:1598-2329(-)